jgi:hypothetical protein
MATEGSRTNPIRPTQMMMKVITFAGAHLLRDVPPDGLF